MGRYIDPRTDFGFKRLFGQEDSKDILRQFLFDILALPHPIAELNYIPVEQLPASPDDRRGIYHALCIDVRGQRFIAQIHHGIHAYSKERVLYHALLALTQETEWGPDWQLSPLPVYCLVLLVYNASSSTDQQPFRHIQLIDIESQTIFYNKLNLFYIELMHFNGALSCATPVERWLFLLKHLVEFEHIPQQLAFEPFLQMFELARETGLSPDEHWYYEGSLKQARDFNAKLSAAYQQGFIKGYREALQESQSTESNSHTQGFP
jgi:hypothetical protein